MNEKKLAAICAAYGDAWDKVKDYVDEKGWCDAGYDNHFHGPKEFCAFGTDRWRPMILNGISRNNGWVRSDERLPGESEETILFCEKGIPAGAEHWKRGWEFRIMVNRHGADIFTHWRPIDPVKPPIY